MTSQSISESTLGIISETAKAVGYPKALHAHLDLPSFDLAALKERALAHYIGLSTSHQDPYLIVRAWLKAYEDLMAYSGVAVRFSFPHIDLCVSEKNDT